MQFAIKNWLLAPLLSASLLSGAALAGPEVVGAPSADAVMAEDISGKVVVGWIEKGLILPEHTAVKIKVDSGALTSSMHAKNLKRFTRKGKKWVRYDVNVIDADTGKRVTMQFERPVYRQILVRGAGGEDHRPVVKMRMCIGNKVYEEQFSLRDRSSMTYPVLIGRRTIEHIGLIDVSSTFMLPLECPEAAEQNERIHQQQLKEDATLVDDSQVDKPIEAEEEDDESESGE